MVPAIPPPAMIASDHLSQGLMSTIDEAVKHGARHRRGRRRQRIEHVVEKRKQVGADLQRRGDREADERRRRADPVEPGRELEVAGHRGGACHEQRDEDPQPGRRAQAKPDEDAEGGIGAREVDGQAS